MIINLVKPHVGLIFPTPLPPEMEVLKHLERVGRVCYKSEERISSQSAIAFIENIIKRKHDAVLEHFDFTALFTIDRGLLQELRTHRIASFLAESTRWCNYENKGFTFIIPEWVQGIEASVYDIGDVYNMRFVDNVKVSENMWINSVWDAAAAYTQLLELGLTPQYARAVLPNSLKTEVVAKMNIRQWKYVLNLRSSSAAHPEMQSIMKKLLNIFKFHYPILFNDMEVTTC